MPLLLGLLLADLSSVLQAEVGDDDEADDQDYKEDDPAHHCAPHFLVHEEVLFDSLSLPNGKITDGTSVNHEAKVDNVSVGRVGRGRVLGNAGLDTDQLRTCKVVVRYCWLGRTKVILAKNCILVACKADFNYADVLTISFGLDVINPVAILDL